MSVLCLSASAGSLQLCQAAGPLRAAWVPMRRMLSPSAWRGSSPLSLASQRRLAAGSARAEPLEMGQGDDAANQAAAQQQRQQLEQQTHQQHHGAIELVVGPMFAGKTTELLRRVAHYEAEGLTVAVVKSDKDNRYCSQHVVTHNGLKRPCFAAPTLSAFKQAAGEAYASYHVIAVDEAQFFPDLKEFCAQAADHEHKRVVLAGLDGDFQRQRFGQVLDLLPMADQVTKLTAHCKFCAQEQRRVAAVFSLRITADSRQEVVGGSDVYAPVCRRHYVQLSQVRSVPLSSDDEGASGSQP